MLKIKARPLELLYVKQVFYHSATSLDEAKDF